MTLEYYKDYICVPEGDKPNITISKKALEEWRDHYLKVAEKYKDKTDKADVWKWGFYTGKADVLTDILKHFEEE